MRDHATVADWFREDMRGNMRLAGKVAVITGGASGMGKATVLRFLQEGPQVVIADFNASTGEAVLAEAADRDALTRLTFDPGEDFAPIWTPDGKMVTHASEFEGECLRAAIL